MSEIQASRHPDSRSGLTLLQPNASPWTQSYGYDAAERLTSVASPAGAFSYAYDSRRVALSGTLSLPNGATIATSYDFMARLTNTTLRSSQQAVLNHHGYGCNAASQRTSVMNLAGNTVAYAYDRAGQLIQASGKEANGTTRLNEQFGYGYDDENQLITVIVTNGVSNSTLSKFAYDGFGRHRVRTECVWQNGGWATNALVRYVHDGMVVLQERDGNNLLTVTYTRGRDLSGSLQGAGGIGGLLSRTDQTTPTWSHAYYQADGNGNVTCLINEKQAVVARYVHDPFGNVLSLSGPLAEVNLYRFSSKEAHPVSGLVYYGFRFYDPNLQRWLNRDLLAEAGGINLYDFVLNEPMQFVDKYGLDVIFPADRSKETQKLKDAYKEIRKTDAGRILCDQLEKSKDTFLICPVKGHGSVYDAKNKIIAIDLNPYPIKTPEGSVPASTERKLAHEMGHACGEADEMKNIIKNENPVAGRVKKKQGPRIKY